MRAAVGNKARKIGSVSALCSSRSCLSSIMASKACSLLFLLLVITLTSAQRPGGGLSLPGTPGATPGGQAAAPTPANPKPTRPPVIYAPESSINFNWGYLTVRAGCCLRALGNCKKTSTECNDAPDQGTWQQALDMWSKAGDTWVDTCTNKGKQKMGVGCKPATQPFVSEGAQYKPGPNTWVQYWLKKQMDYISVNSVLQNSLLDARYNKMWLHKSTITFLDGFLYIASGGAVGLNETQIYMEDSYQGELSSMGAAAIGVRGKVGAVRSGIVLNNSVFGWNEGKIWLIESSYKQYGGAFIVENTSFWFESSQMSFWDMQQGHVANTVWNLTNSQLNLVKSTLRVWDSTIILSGSHLNLNESRLLLSNTVVLGDNFAFSTVNVSDTFGVTLGERLDALNVDFKVEAEDGKIVLKAKKETPANGR